VSELTKTMTLEHPPSETAEPSPSPVSSIGQDYRKRLMVFGGRASGTLAAKIAGQLDVDLGQADLRTFSNGEVYCRYQESIRGADVFIVQSTAANEAAAMTPNDALMELLCMIDAAQGASAHRIIAVMPWYGYARQDKKSLPREPISARVVAKSLEAVGVDRVLTMDLHAGQVQGFFEVPVDHMTAMPMLTQWFIDQHFDEELVIVSPDAGRVKVARNFARKVGTHWAVMEKERPAQQVAEIGYVVGDVKGKTAVLVDDMIDTAGTLCAAAKTVLDEGAARVIACATHGVFSGPAPRRPSRQHPRALDRADPRRLDPADLHRRLGLGDLRRREPALLSGAAGPIPARGGSARGGSPPGAAGEDLRRGPRGPPPALRSTEGGSLGWIATDIRRDPPQHRLRASEAAGSPLSRCSSPGARSTSRRNSPTSASTTRGWRRSRAVCSCSCSRSTRPSTGAGGTGGW